MVSEHLGKPIRAPLSPRSFPNAANFDSSNVGLTDTSDRPTMAQSRSLKVDHPPLLATPVSFSPGRSSSTAVGYLCPPGDRQCHALGFVPKGVDMLSNSADTTTTQVLQPHRQAPQYLRSPETQAASDGCFALPASLSAQLFPLIS